MDDITPTPLNESPKNEKKDPEIHTMPDQFLRSGKKKHQGSISPITMGICIVSGVAVLLVIGTYLMLFVFNNSSNNNTSPIANTPDFNIDLVQNRNSQNNNPSGNANGALNTNAARPTNDNPSLNLNSSANLNSNTNQTVNTNLNMNVNKNANINASISVPNTHDTDEDGLTDQEEALYDTNETLKDTDGDEYIDGLEVMNGYSPLLAPASRLEKTSYVKPVSSSEHQFSALIPASWAVEERTSNEMMFITETTEFIEILIEQKKESLSIEDWYTLQVGDEASEYLLADINGFDAVVSSNGLTYYIGDQDKVFIVTYNYGTKERINYRTSFLMILDTFERRVREESKVNQNQNLNTNASKSNENKNGNVNTNQTINANRSKGTNKNQNTNTKKNSNSSEIGE